MTTAARSARVPLRRAAGASARPSGEQGGAEETKCEVEDDEAERRHREPTVKRRDELAFGGRSPEDLREVGVDRAAGDLRNLLEQRVIRLRFGILRPGLFESRRRREPVLVARDLLPAPPRRDLDARLDP